MPSKINQLAKKSVENHRLTDAEISSHTPMMQGRFPQGDVDMDCGSYAKNYADQNVTAWPYAFPASSCGGCAPASGYQ